ncbi:MAG: hypothetical protein ACE5I9_06235 [Candidatus Methylomirabilales bacterium]
MQQGVDAMTEYARPFRHDALFSTYYLERLLPQDEGLGAAVAERVDNKGFGG